MKEINMNDVITIEMKSFIINNCKLLKSRIENIDTVTYLDLENIDFSNTSEYECFDLALELNDVLVLDINLDLSKKIKNFALENDIEPCKKYILNNKNLAIEKLLDYREFILMEWSEWSLPPKLKEGDFSSDDFLKFLGFESMKNNKYNENMYSVKGLDYCYKSSSEFLAIDILLSRNVLK